MTQKLASTGDTPMIKLLRAGFYLCIFLGANLMAQADETVSDYDLIKTTIGHYFDGLRLADRARLERAFAVEYAHMKGYIKDANGKLVESSRPMNEVIDEWVAREPNPALKGRIVSINIYSDIAAQATFDFNGVYTDAFQLAKINGEWRIMNKFYVNQ
jgi:hypothetical protein